MIELAEGQWERSTIERALVSYGWARPADESGGVVVEWGGGPGSPHFFGRAPGDERVGWRIELGGGPTGPEDHSSYVRLPCALFWPAFGEEPADADPDDEDELDGQYGDDWARLPDAARADFHAEYRRIGALIRAELGEPLEVTEGELDEYTESWHLAGLRVTLCRTDDLNSYSHYDVITLGVGPARD